MTNVRTWAGSTLVAGALVLTACSSSGGGSRPSESEITKKLNSDSTVLQLKSQLPSAAQSKYPAIVSCIAKALHKDADAGALRDYVDGKRKIEKLSGDKDQAQKDVESCVKSVVGSG